MENWFRKSLAESLDHLLATSEGIAFLQSWDEKRIHEIARQLLAEDPFRDVNRLATSACQIWGDNSPLEFISHSLWCAHRDVLWQRPALDRAGISLEVAISGSEHLLATGGMPAILISPMTVCTGDAIECIMEAREKYQPGRPLVFYGEDMGAYLEREPELEPFFAPATSAGIRKIRSVLKQNGIFLTYSDFVYRHHSVHSGRLFGLPKAYSRGFLAIAAASQSAFLPGIVYHRTGTLELQFFSPMRQPVDSSLLPRAVQEQALCLVLGKLLEGLIIRVRNQWRLLPTLSHEADEMALP